LLVDDESGVAELRGAKLTPPGVQKVNLFGSFFQLLSGKTVKHQKEDSDGMRRKQIR
jgi:hypothetical protein